MTRTAGTPLDLQHGPTWRNRVSLAPLTNKQSHLDGTLSDAEHDWLVARGRGGFGLTMTCAAYVNPTGRAWAGQLGVADDAHLPGLTRLADSLRATGTVSSVQLHHGGFRADGELNGLPVKGVWDDPAKGATALTVGEIEDTLADFVAAARRAEEAGFDGVELHGAHSYLPCAFLDARSNHREDGWGGDLEGRARFLLTALREIRAGTGPGLQVGVRLSPQGWGISVEDAVQVTMWVLASGDVDYVDLSMWDVFAMPRTGGDVPLLDHFTGLDRHGAALGVTGAILGARDLARCLERDVDFVGVGVGGILHHDWPRLALDDPTFTARERPVSRQVLRDEHVGEDFIDYLAEDWKDFVAS